MNTFSQNRQVKLIKPQNKFYKQINQDINTNFISKKFIKLKYLRLTEEYYEKLGAFASLSLRRTETKVHFDEYCKIRCTFT